MRGELGNAAVAGVRGAALTPHAVLCLRLRLRFYAFTPFYAFTVLRFYRSKRPDSIITPLLHRFTPFQCYTVYTVSVLHRFTVLPQPARRPLCGGGADNKYK